MTVHPNARRLIVVVFATACMVLALSWPAWRMVLGTGYYNCDEYRLGYGPYGGYGYWQSGGYGYGYGGYGYQRSGGYDYGYDCPGAYGPGTYLRGTYGSGE